MLQPYYDLAKLLRKGMVLSRPRPGYSSPVPWSRSSTALLAALLVPLGGHRCAVRFTGDLVLFAYLFGLARFFTIAAALDTGSAFEGMGGAAR